MKYNNSNISSDALSVSLLLIAVISSIIAPYTLTFGGQHISMFIFVVLILYHFVVNGMSRTILIVASIAISFSIFTSLYLNIYEGHRITASAVRVVGPILALFVVFVVVYNARISELVALRILVVLSILFCIFVVLQLVLGKDLMGGIYYTSARARELRASWLYVVAPFPSPNTTGLAIAVLICLLQLPDYQTWRRRYFRDGRTPWYMRKAGRGMLLSILLAGLVFAYARTALVALVVAEVLLLFHIFRAHRLPKWTWFVGSAVVILPIVGLVLSRTSDPFMEFVAGDVNAFRTIQYYGTLLSPFSQNSMIDRFGIWSTMWDVILRNKFVLLFGGGEYRMLLLGEGVPKILDSSYVYMIFVLGFPLTFAIVILSLVGAVSSAPMRPVIILLLICGITYPFISDVRMSLFLGSILGLGFRMATAASERHPTPAANVLVRESLGHV